MFFTRSRGMSLTNIGRKRVLVRVRLIDFPLRSIAQLVRLVTANAIYIARHLGWHIDPFGMPTVLALQRRHCSTLFCCIASVKQRL